MGVRSCATLIDYTLISTVKPVNKLARVPLLLGVMMALVGGLLGGLQLLGAVPRVGNAATVHGALMAFGFLGTAISLERSVATRRPVALAVPALFVTGSVLALAGWVVPAGVAWAAGFGGLGVVYGYLLRRAVTPALAVQAAGAITGLGAAITWALTADMEQALAGAVLFPLSTIVGERLELARLRMATKENAIAVLLLAVCAASFTGNRPLLGVGLVIVAAVMAWSDVAVVLIRRSGLPRYSAAAMLAGYLWLAVAGVTWVVGGSYDQVVHAVFLGFVFSMIMAHAPIIVAGVLQLAVGYHRVLWLPLVALHASLLIRVVVDARWGGVIGVGAIVCFLLLQVTVFLRGKGRS